MHLKKKKGGRQTWQPVNEGKAVMRVTASETRCMHMCKAHLHHSISPDCEHRWWANSPALTASHHLSNTVCAYHIISVMDHIFRMSEYVYVPQMAVFATWQAYEIMLLTMPFFKHM